MNIQTTFEGRLFHFLRNSPYIEGLIEILSDPMQDSNDAMEFILDAFDLDTAAGEQLELLGGLLGIPRPPAQEPNYFRLERMGETDDLDNDHGFYESDGTGGYMIAFGGLQAVDGSEMSDTDYRFLLKQKAASYRRKATVSNLHAYLIAFGSRCKIDDDTLMEIEFDPVTYYDLNNWEKYYVVTRGFKPGGIDIYFRENMRDEGSV